MVTKSKRPDLLEIERALKTHPGREAAIANLREKGYKFQNSWFRAMADLIEAEEENPDLFEDNEDTEIEIIPGGIIQAADKARAVLKPGIYVFTCAQSNTRVHPGFLQSLESYCLYRNASLHVSTFTYNKSGFQELGVKPGSKKSSDTTEVWFDSKIVKYTSDESLQVAEDLVWCGELNIIPTRINPLSSFNAYTRQASAIIPHVKMAMQSMPTMKMDPAKFLYSTGTVTQRNYIQKLSGQVADFHHVFGALVVEVGKDGIWFARQLNADDSGMFYDLTTQYLPDGTVKSICSRPLAINHGDIHWNKRDTSVMDAMFMDEGILDKLHPKNQFFHDTVDFQARNHHNIKDPHFMHKMQIEGTDNVKQEFDEAGEFIINDGYRDWCNSYIVTSNHDQAIEIWLRNPAGQIDPTNAFIWHMWNAEAYLCRVEGREPRPFMEALKDGMSYAGASKYLMDSIKFLHEDDSLWLKNIQFGLHGHLGPSGARGNPKNLRTVGKANTGHTHSAGIVDGVYTAGVFGLMDMGYNKGLSAWSHSFILTYDNGKRSIITMKDGRAWL